MKRSTSAERETPKKRRKSRGHRTISPSSRQRTPGPSITMKEVKASSQSLNKALQSHKMGPGRVPSLVTDATALESAAPVLVTPPATSPTENLESVVQKIPASSNSADGNMSNGNASNMVICEEKTAATHDATPKTKGDEEERKEVDDKATTAAKSEPAADKNAESDGILAQAIIHETVPVNSPKPETGLGDARDKDVEIVAAPRQGSGASPDDARDKDVEIVAAPRQGSGTSPDDAMIVDSSPCKQLKREHQLSQLAADAGGSHPSTTPGTVVTSEWLLEKLDSLTPSTLSSDRAAIIQELHEMEAGLARLPRTTLHHPPVHLRRNGPAERLQLVEKLIGAQLLQIPVHAWRAYKSKLLRLCAAPGVHNMDFRQRLEKVKEVVYLPEEAELLRRGDAGRMGCAVRVCATVTEILGPEEEHVPEEMSAWVAAQLQDVAWKAKVTAAWRKYWPEPEEMVID